MPRLPNVSAFDVVKALKKCGYIFNRQKGDHIILVNVETHRIAVIPNRKEIPRGTLRSIISEVGLTVDEFVKLLR